VGYDIDESNGLSVCTSADQTGCQVSWNAVGPEPATIISTENSICVNPLSWMANDQQVESTANLGGVSFNDTQAKVEVGVANAICAGGRLTVTEINSETFAGRPMGFDNLHVYDYSLFYMNIRENAQLRVKTFLAGNAP